VSNLNSLGYLTNTTGTGSFAVGNYVVQIQRTPVGCVGLACDLSGLVYLDTPVVRNLANEINGSWIAGWLKATGANGGYSTQGNPTLITGPGWTADNPVAGKPAGIVAIRFGFGSSGLAQFAKTTDTRPIDFQNTLHVGGAATLDGAVTVTTTLGVTGASTLNGATAINNTLAVSGATTINNTLGVTGAIQAASLATTGDSVATGNAKGSQLVPTGSFAPGAACTNSGALSNNSTASGWVACQGGIWVAFATTATAGGGCAPDFSEATSTTGGKLVCLGGVYVPSSSLYAVGVAGSACTTEGRQGYDSGASYVQLICRRNPSYATAPLLWYRLQDLTGFKEFVGGGTFAHGAVIVKPICAAVGNSPRIAIIDFLGSGAAGTSDGAFNEKAVDNGSSWTMSLADGSGAPLTSSAGYATKQVSFYCYTY
jgi:hypothetical protein